ncbi:MAG: hypothetical protein HY849_01825 [Nitrosomonadales bacterium]|nr:hypothetical protein [Nitrosomonadales bacterium]
MTSKIITRAAFLATVSFLLLLGSPPAVGDERIPYTFPVVPGTPEWMALTSHAEMIGATEIPGKILRRMDTATLLETCVNYPLREDFLAYDTPQRGIEAVIAQFNGLRELSLRRDAGRLVLGVGSRIVSTLIRRGKPGRGQVAFSH